MADTGFTIPTLDAIVERVADDVKSHVPGADVRLRRRISRAVALALGGVSYLLHKFALNVAKETLPDCASGTGVDRWASMFGLPDVAPVASTGPIDFAGVGTTAIPTGTELVRGDGALYTVDAPGGALVAGVATLPVTASATGAAGDAEAGVTLTLTTPIAGLDSTATVGTGDVDGGVSEEAVEAKRVRVLDRMASPPQGGSNPDYVGWVKEAVGNVRRVFVSPNESGVGHITIRFILEPATGDPVDAIPSSGQAQAALDFIVGTAAEGYKDAAGPVPVVGDENYRVAIATAPHLTAQPVTWTFSALDPNTTAVQESVDAALKALLLQRGEPGGTITLDQFVGAVDAAPGEVSATISLIDGGAPADVVIGADSWPTFGSTTYPV